MQHREPKKPKEHHANIGPLFPLPSASCSCLLRFPSCILGPLGSRPSLTLSSYTWGLSSNSTRRCRIYLQHYKTTTWSLVLVGHSFVWHIQVLSDVYSCTSHSVSFFWQSTLFLLLSKFPNHGLSVSSKIPILFIHITSGPGLIWAPPHTSIVILLPESCLLEFTSSDDSQ